MDKVRAVIEDAGISDIYDIFTKKPAGLKFNETDVVNVTARTEDGDKVTRSFYFCLKPDGTFDEMSIARDLSRGRRHRLATFIRYYGMAKEIKRYNLKERIGEWIGKSVEVVPSGRGGIIYVP